MWAYGTCTYETHRSSSMRKFYFIPSLFGIVFVCYLWSPCLVVTSSCMDWHHVTVACQRLTFLRIWRRTHRFIGNQLPDKFLEQHSTLTPCSKKKWNKITNQFSQFLAAKFLGTGSRSNWSMIAVAFGGHCGS